MGKHKRANAKKRRERKELNHAQLVASMAPEAVRRLKAKLLMGSWSDTCFLQHVYAIKEALSAEGLDGAVAMARRGPPTYNNVRMDPQTFIFPVSMATLQKCTGSARDRAIELVRAGKRVVVHQRIENAKDPLYIKEQPSNDYPREVVYAVAI